MYSYNHWGVLMYMYTYIHTQDITSCLLKSGVKLTDIHSHKDTYAHVWSLAQVHIYLVARWHTSGSGSRTRMRRYIKFLDSLPQCGMSLLSREGWIADCTVQHPCVERPFSSLLCFLLIWDFWNLTEVFIFFT